MEHELIAPQSKEQLNLANGWYAVSRKPVTEEHLSPLYPFKREAFSTEQKEIHGQGEIYPCGGGGIP